MIGDAIVTASKDLMPLQICEERSVMGNYRYSIFTKGTMIAEDDGFETEEEAVTAAYIYIEETAELQGSFTVEVSPDDDDFWDDSPAPNEEAFWNDRESAANDDDELVAAYS